VFQNIYVKLFEAAKKKIETISLISYLFKIARNQCLNVAQQKYNNNTTIELSDDFDIEYEDDFSMRIENAELHTLIIDSLNLLELPYREALLLKEFDDLSYEEIADITGTTLNNAKSRVFRAKAQIRKLLAPYIKELSR
jgi:RNA polymerase sigma-70 factor (ECF subfamily)